MNVKPRHMDDADTGELYDVETLNDRLERENRSDVVLTDDISEHTSEANVSKKYSKGVVVFMMFLGLVVGIWVGRNAIAPKSYPTQPSPVITVTEKETTVIHEPGPKAELPASCKTAFTLLEKMEPYLGSVLGVNGKVSDVLRDSRMAIVSTDQQELIKASNRMNDLTDEMSKDQNNLMPLIQQYKEAMTSCTTALK